MSAELGSSSSPSRDAAGLTLAGRLDAHGLADILRSLVRSRDSAQVILEREGVTKIVHVHAGRVVFARSSDRDDRLGECLLRDGMISVEQYEQSGRLIRPGKRQGTILVELGYITPAELVKGVKVQVEHVVTDLLSWRHGAFRIEMGEPEMRDVISLNISTENLMFHGIKRGAGWSQVVRGLGGTLDSVLSRAQDFDTKLYKLDLSDDESHVVSLVNGRLSAAQACSMSYMSNHDTCLTLFALACCGVVETGHARDAETLFREQVAESEMQEALAALRAHDAAMTAVEAAWQAAHGDDAPARMQSAVASVLDEHWDVLREATRPGGRLDESVIAENLAAIDPSVRAHALGRALSALQEAIAATAGTAQGEVRSAFMQDAGSRPRAGKQGT